MISFNYLSKTFSAVSTNSMENFFNGMGFYAPGDCMLGHIPVYVPIGYVVAFHSSRSIFGMNISVAYLYMA